MTRFPFGLVVVLAAVHFSYCMPVLNGTRSTVSLNETNEGKEELDITKENGTKVSDMIEKNENVTKNNETKGEKVVENGVNATEVEEKKVDGPSDILYPVCSEYLGISNRNLIKDQQMTASSTYEIKTLLKMINDSLKEMETNSTKASTETNTRSNFTIQGNQTAPHHGRLGNHLGSWCASADGFDGDHNLVVDLGHVRILEAVITQGRTDSDNWVTNYTVSHSSDKKKWYPIKKNGEVVVFRGNKDRNSGVVASFPHRIAARYIKFIPKSYHGKLMCMRVEAVGCHPDAVNVAKNQPTVQSSTKHNFNASKAVDGDFVHDLENDTCTNTHRQNFPWLRIDLRRVYQVKEIIISDHGHRAGLDLQLSFEVRVGREMKNEGNDNPFCSSGFPSMLSGQIKTIVCKNGTFGRYVNIRIPRLNSKLALCEVAVIGVAEKIVRIGLDDIANSLQTGSVTDNMGEVENIVGGLLGKFKQALGGGMLNQLQGQGMGMLNQLQGQGMGMLNNLKGQGMGMLNNMKGQGLAMANKMKKQGLEMADKMKKQGMEMADKAKKQAMEMADKAKKQAMEMADKAKKQGMEMADKAKKQGMEMADKAKKQGMEMANKLQGQGMAMVGDMQGQMNQQQDKFKKKLKELLKKGKKYLKIGKEEMEKFKKKGYIETGKRYVDVGLTMTMDAIAFIQAKLMESIGSIASDMTKQITTLSEYDTSDVKGLLDDVDPVPVREFVEEAKPKIADYIDEMQELAKKYIDIGIEKAKQAKDEIENEAQSAANQATSMGKNMAGKATSMGKNMAGKATSMGKNMAGKATSMGKNMASKATSMGKSLANKAKEAGMKAVDKAKAAGMGALNKAKGAGMGALNNLKQTGMGALGQAQGMGMGMFGQLKQAGMGALGQVQGLGTGILGKLSGAGIKLLKKAGSSSQVNQMQQVQLLQQLKQMKRMEELQKKLEEEQDGQWEKFELLTKAEYKEDVLKDISEQNEGGKE